MGSQWKNLVCHGCYLSKSKDKELTMGLFDRIKKAFTGKDNSEDEKVEKKIQEKAQEETDQTAEAEKTTADSDKEVAPKAAESKETVEESAEQAPETDEKKSEEVKEEVQESKPEPQEESKKPETEESAVKQAETQSVEQPEETTSNQDEEPKTTKESIQSVEHIDALQSVTPAQKLTSTTATPTESIEPKKDIESVEETATEQSETDNSEPQESEVTSEETTEESENVKTDDSVTEEPVSEPETEEKPKDDVEEYDKGLKKSRNSFSARFNRFLANFRSVDEDFFDDLEQLLIESDVGYETAMRISDELREEVKLENAKKRSDVSNVIVQKLVDMYGEEGKEEDNSLKMSTDKTPTVFLFVGVNGAGKTTTVGKLAHRYEQQGKKVLLAAADTFRAGAIEQLQEWGKRDGVPVQASKAHTDPASVVYDAVQRAKEEDFDILLVDTAGRLQNKEGLMRELEKIKRVITRELPEAPQEVLLVLDGSTGQNALSQAKQFNETTEVTGIVLTKIDGSSQGGIVLAIRNELHIPVKLVGLGEQMDDLRDFDPEKFIYGLFKELIVGTSNK